MQLEVVCHGFISMEALIEQPVDLRQVVGPRNLITKIHLATVTLYLELETKVAEDYVK